MKSLVYVMVPQNTPRDRIVVEAGNLLKTHRQIDEIEKGKYDYLVQPGEKIFNDQMAEWSLPTKEQKSFKGLICAAERLPEDCWPAAIVTPDGVWQDQFDHGWQFTGNDEGNRQAMISWISAIEALVQKHQDCWILCYCAHS